MREEWSRSYDWDEGKEKKLVIGKRKQVQGNFFIRAHCLEWHL